MEIRRGDIFYIERYYSVNAGSSVTSPGRPGIVVSNDSNNRYSETVEIVYLTTQPKKDLPTHCSIRSSQKPSTALCEQVHTINAEQLGDYMGSCNEAEMRAVDACLAISLGLTFDAAPPKPSAEPKEVVKEVPVVDQQYIDEKNEEIKSLEEKIKSLTESLDQITASLIESKARETLLRELYDSLVRAKTE